MPVKVIIPDTVSEELQTIGDFIAADSSPQVAQTVMRQIRMRCLSLETLPNRGAKYLENLRCIFEGRYRIIYRVEESPNETSVFVLTIHHTARREPEL